MSDEDSLPPYLKTLQRIRNEKNAKHKREAAQLNFEIAQGKQLYGIEMRGAPYLETAQGRVNSSKIEELKGNKAKLLKEIADRRAELHKEDTSLTEAEREQILKEIQERMGEIGRLNDTSGTITTGMEEEERKRARFRNLGEEALAITAAQRALNFNTGAFSRVKPLAHSPPAMGAFLKDVRTEPSAYYIGNTRVKLRTDPLFTSVQNYCFSERPTEFNRERFMTLCDAGEVDIRDKFNCTPLMYVSALGNRECMERLMVNHADPNAQDEDGNTPLIFAAGDHLPRGWKFENDIYENTLLFTGIKHLRWSLPRGKLKTEEKATLAVTLLLNGISRVAKYAKKVAHPNLQNNSGITALMVAAKAGHTEVVRVLLEGGADPNIQDTTGVTTLMAAAQAGRTEVARVLLEGGADPNIQDKEGLTALMYSFPNRRGRTLHAGLIEILLDAKADHSIRDSGERTVLMYAAHLGTLGEVETLLASGPEINAKDSNGNTALDYTKSPEMRALLVGNGAESGKKQTLVEAQPERSLPRAASLPRGCLPGSSCAIMGGRVKYTRRRFRKRARRTFRRAN